MTTTYSHVRIHTDRPQHFREHLVSELGSPAPSAGRASSLDVDGANAWVRTTDDQLSIMLEAPHREIHKHSEGLITSRLQQFAGPDALTVNWSDPVRPATLDDDEALLNLDRKSWTAIASFPSAKERVQPTFFSTGGRSPDGVLVAERDGEIVGMVKVHPKTPFPEGAHVYSIINLVVAPQARRQGVASMLLTVAEHVARSRGASRLSLLVFSSNLPAIQLYTDHEYVLEGRFPNEFLINGEYVDDLSLGKPIEI